MGTLSPEVFKHRASSGPDVLATDFLGTDQIEVSFYSRILSIC